MQKKLAVEMVVGMGLSGRKRACRVMGLARSSAYYRRDPSVVGLAKDGLVGEVPRGERSFPARKVIEVLEEVMACTRRSPEH